MMDGYIKKRAKIVSIRKYDKTICSSRVIMVKAVTTDGEVVDIEWARELNRKPKEAFDSMWKMCDGEPVQVYLSTFSQFLTYCVPTSQI